MLILQEVWKFRVLQVLPLCRSSVFVVSLVTEGRNMSHFITQFYLECQIQQTSLILATLWTGPNPVLPSLAGIPNHWLKGGLWAKIRRGSSSRGRPIRQTGRPRIRSSQQAKPSNGRAYSLSLGPFSIAQYLKWGQFPPRDPICSCANVTF